MEISDLEANMLRMSMPTKDISELVGKAADPNLALTSTIEAKEILMKVGNALKNTSYDLCNYKNYYNIVKNANA